MLDWGLTLDLRRYCPKNDGAKKKKKKKPPSPGEKKERKKVPGAIPRSELQAAPACFYRSKRGRRRKWSRRNSAGEKSRECSQPTWRKEKEERARKPPSRGFGERGIIGCDPPPCSVKRGGWPGPGGEVKKKIVVPQQG